MTAADLAQMTDALWRAMTYVSVAQVHLTDNVLLRQRLKPAHVKVNPSGHWGTVPGTAWALSHMALVPSARRLADAGIIELTPVIGAGHAGVVQMAAAWLTEDLAAVRPGFTRDVAGLRSLVRAFPDVEGLGHEIHPALPGGAFVGGQLGPALPFAQGYAADAPGRLVVPLIGDGECETPVTAGSWLAGPRTLASGMVLPIVHLNGHRMGSRSVLGRMTDGELAEYFAGPGWTPLIVEVTDGSIADHDRFSDTLGEGLRSTVQGIPTVIVMRCVKGWGGPAELDTQLLMGTAALHKTPLRAPHKDARQLAALEQWLGSYLPDGLFDDDGTPVGALAQALAMVSGRRKSNVSADRPDLRTSQLPASADRSTTFAEAVTTVVRRHAEFGDLRVFSPDELASNRLVDLADEPYVAEVLAEELCMAWLTGWITSGRRGLLVSYEAFAPLMTTALIQHLKTRRLARTEGVTWPSLNLIMTSYGWQNTYTHGDPSLVTAALATCDASVHVFTPADATRVGMTLDAMLASNDSVNILVAGKHPGPVYPVETVVDEIDRGLAVWPHSSDGGEPDLVLVGGGDLPAAAFTAAMPELRNKLGLRVRYVHLQDLTVLGAPAAGKHGLSRISIDHYFGSSTPLLIGTLGHSAAIWGLLAGRWNRPIQVLGWPEVPHPMNSDGLLTEAGLTTDRIVSAAVDLLRLRKAS